MSKKSINICFVANFYKTFLFHKLAIELSKQNVGVFWIVTKANQYNYLKEYYKDESILYINRSHVYKPAEMVDDFRLNELVYGDRVFKHDKQSGLNFLTNIQRPIYDFLLLNKIRFVIGEITWAHELLIHRLTKKMRELECMHLNCSVVRIPNYRVAFFTNESASEMLEFSETINSNEIIKVEKPAYLHLNDKIVKKKSSLTSKFARVKRFISGENIEKNDPNVITDRFTRFKVMSKEELNKITYKRVRTVKFEEVENDNYVFLGFHKQPESSIDVSGRYFEDQALNVINLWRLLPQGWKILIKEHTNAIGDRSTKFYNRLLEFPNIVLLDEKTDSKRIIEKSKLVATVTGTIAYEAALLKVPAITLSRVFFNRINYCRYVTLSDLIEYDNLQTLIEEIKSQPDNRLEFSNYIMQNTFEGYVSDYVSDPTVMEDENVEKLCIAFMKVVECYGNPTS